MIFLGTVVVLCAHRFYVCWFSWIAVKLCFLLGTTGKKNQAYKDDAMGRKREIKNHNMAILYFCMSRVYFNESHSQTAILPGGFEKIAQHCAAGKGPTHHFYMTALPHPPIHITLPSATYFYSPEWKEIIKEIAEVKTKPSEALSGITNYGAEPKMFLTFA